MEKRYKKFIICFFIGILLTSSIIMFVNYKIDAYGIFSNSYSKVGEETNKNYIKTKYILENPEKYDSFIFGSSRVEYIPVDDLNTGEFYNMTYVQGTPSEWMMTLNEFDKNNVKMKNIIIAIDDFHSIIYPEEHFKSPNTVPYTYLKENPMDIIKLYLLKNPLDKRNIEIITKGRPGGVDIETNGRVNRVDDEEFYKSEFHIDNQKFQVPIILGDYKNDRIDSTINEIKSIVEFCKNKEIKLTVLFNPLHKTTYENSDKEKISYFKERLAEVTSYWDFNQINEITQNNYYWYETSHYRELVGDMILKKIFQDDYDKVVEVPADFGVYVKCKEVNV